MDLALISLLKKKSFDYITVSEVCETAGVNRSTFYSNYIDIYDLAEKVKDLGIEKIYSSPLKRAIQTAQAVARKTNSKIDIIPELIEASVGVCEGMHREDVQKQYPDIWNEWYGENMIMETRWPGGESKKESGHSPQNVRG